MTELTGEIFGTGYEYAVAGFAKNGAQILQNDLVSYGHDTVLVRPDLGLFGVFDGAGGAKDIGDPITASQTAAKAYAGVIEAYINTSADLQSDDQYLDMMCVATETARDAVRANLFAGVTTATVAVFRITADESKIFYSQIGDSVLMTYPDQSFDECDEDYLDHITHQQITPDRYIANFLGRERHRGDKTMADSVGYYALNGTQPRYIMLATDGVCGNYISENGIDARDVEYADIVVPTLQRISSQEDTYRVRLWEQWEAIRARLHPDKIVSARRSNVVSPQQVAQTIVDAPLIRDETYPPRPTDDKSLVLIKTKVSRQQ